MLGNYYPNFKAFVIFRNQIEDTINSGVIKIKENKFRWDANHIAKTSEVYYIFTQNLLRLKELQTFTNSCIPINKVFEKVKARGYIQPFNSKALLNPLSLNYHANKYYDCH